MALNSVYLICLAFLLGQAAELWIRSKKTHKIFLFQLKFITEKIQCKIFLTFHIFVEPVPCTDMVKYYIGECSLFHTNCWNSFLPRFTSFCTMNISDDRIQSAFIERNRLGSFTSRSGMCLRLRAAAMMKWTTSRWKARVRSDSADNGSSGSFAENTHIDEPLHWMLIFANLLDCFSYECPWKYRQSISNDHVNMHKASSVFAAWSWLKYSFDQCRKYSQGGRQVLVHS